MKTVSRELSRQLKRAGYPQTGYFWWVYKELGKLKTSEDSYVLYDDTQVSDYMKSRDEIICVAPTAEEILDVLPKTIHHGKMAYRLIIEYSSGRWIVRYFCMRSKVVAMGTVLCEALGDMYLKLKENHLFTVENQEKINKR